MIWVNITSIIVTLSLFVIFRSYRQADVKKIWGEEKKGCLCYGLPLCIWDKLQKGLKHSTRRHHMRRQLQKLYPLFSVEEMEEKFYVRIVKISLYAWIFVHMASIIFTCALKSTDSFYTDGKLMRPMPGNMPYMAQVTVQNDLIGEQNLEFEVSSRRYSDCELKEAFKEARKYVMAHALGENTSWSMIYYPLEIIKEIPDTGISVEWDFGTDELFDESGRVISENIQDTGTCTTVGVKLIYEESTDEFKIPMVIFNEALSEDAKFLKALRMYIQRLNEESREELYLKLPGKVNGQNLTWHIPEKNHALLLTFVGGILAVIYIYGRYGDVQSKLKNRQKQLILDYPDFVYRLVLLTDAGMNMKSALEVMLKNAKQAKRADRYLWQEVQTILRSMSQGGSEIEAYELFGHRCAELVYLKLSTLMVQSIKKGVGGIGSMMQEAAAEAVMMKKEAAIKAGEEVGTKLLLPMGILLIVVLIILIIPAFMSMNI